MNMVAVWAMLSVWIISALTVRFPASLCPLNHAKGLAEKLVDLVVIDEKLINVVEPVVEQFIFAVIDENFIEVVEPVGE